MASAVERLDGFQRRKPWAGMPLAVAYKFFDDQGMYLTALITFYGFLSLFPLLLLLLTVLGFLLAGNPELQEQVVQSALARFPVIGDQIGENVQSLQGSRVALVTGLVVSLYGALGVAQATQVAFNRIWAVPRNARPNPVLSRLRSAALLVVIGGGVLLTTVLSALTSGANAIGNGLGPPARVGVALLAVAVNAVLFLVAFRVLTARAVPVRDHLPGSVGVAAAWQLIQLGGTYYVGHALQGASATYGLFGIVLGLLAWIYLGAFTVVLAAEVNVVRARRLWPRSLMTPFTDDVRLTRADERAYASYAQSERHKGFETVEVGFEGSPDGERPQEPDDPAGTPEGGRSGSRDGDRRGASSGRPAEK